MFSSRHASSLLTFLGLSLVTFLVTATQTASAQPPGMTAEQMQQIQELAKTDPEAAKRMAEEIMKRRGGPPSGDAKPDDKPNDDKPKDEGESKPDGNSGGEADTVKRPDKPEEKPDPEELKAALDDQGMIQFSFQGQPWKEVLQWYADVAQLSFDWTELPGGYLNLTTTRKYTLDETRDLLNQHLLARGYTLIMRGEVLTATKIDKLDPSLVPQVEPDDLESHRPYEFVRVRFPLPETMEPEQAKEDVKILLSPNSKVTPLLASKQLLVIDAVVNLRDVRDLIYAEQMAIKSDVRPTEFPIKYQRAEWIADQVLIVLGKDPASRKSPQELQIEQMRMQMLMQMQQRQKTDISSMIKEEGPPVNLAVDKRRNVLLVNAPPEVLPTIERTINLLDTPGGGAVVADSSAQQMRKYRTSSVSPDVIVTALQDMGSLAPLTQLQTDKKSKTIFAYATPADHATIQAMIDKLDGSGRGLKVIPLSRRSSADQVAGTIHALMVGEKQNEDDNNRRNRYRYGWPYGMDEEDSSDDGDFRIQADLEHNRLLLWATPAEYDEVMSLLTTLGVVSLPGAGGNRLRVMEAGDPEATARLLERLQRSWGGKNPLIINGPPPAEDDDKTDQPPKDDAPAADEQRDRLTHSVDRFIPLAGRLTPAQFVQLAEGQQQPAADGETATSEGESSEAPAPIRVTVTPDGRLVLSSEDVAALDQLEDLLLELEPPQADFKVFDITNVDAFDVYLNLKDYFEEELKGQKETVYDYWGDYAGTRDKDSGPMTLGRRRPLRFIWDPATNTILVQGASRSQMAIIEELIEIYDRPVGEDAVASRRTEAIPIVYSNARDIEKALKEVYRDLLSSKDKEFANGGKDGQKSTRTETYYRFYGGGGGDDKDKKSAPVKMKFEGELSIGVDEISNTLIISAEEQVWESIRAIVTQLDERAKPNTTVEVCEVQAPVSSTALKAALAQALSQPWPGGKPPGQTGQKQSGGEGGGDDKGNQGNQRGNRNRE